MNRMTRLTLRRLLAIEEALSARLAGEMDDVEDIERDDYEKAHDWVAEEIDKRRQLRALLGRALPR